MRCYRPERTLRIGSLVLGAEPRIVAVVAAPDVEAAARRAREQGADLIEVRLDRDRALTAARARAVLRAAKAETGLPVVAPVRLATELGDWLAPDAARLPIFAAAAEEADLLDVELAATEIRAAVVALCRGAGRGSIVSFHDTAATPP